MSAPPVPGRLHAERTRDPAVVRWVVHVPALARSPHGPRVPPHRSAFGDMLATGSIVGVAVDRGDVLVEATEAATWPALAPVVRVALDGEIAGLLHDATHWLLTPAGGAESSSAEPSLAQLQAVVDRAAGALMGGHGGSMQVVRADRTTVWLAAGGACDGCSLSDTTIANAIAPAVRAAFPEMSTVALEPARREPVWSRIGVRSRAGGSCH